MICASCGEGTTGTPCGACGGDPLLAGRYRLESRIGRGGHGTVYRGVDGDGAAVAVKEVSLGAGEKLDELALREVAVLQQLSHPAVPAYLDHVVAGQGRGRALFVVQRFVEGPSLAEELERRRYSEDEVLAVIEELCDVLGYLHGRSPPVIHRDLKPSNVMRGPDGLVLVDFGAVRDVLKTQLGGSTVAGTFGFMAPEQFRGEATPATDVFGLGALAVALLSRKDPAELHDRRGTFSWQGHVQLSGPVQALLERMTAPDPADRPQNVDAVRQALAEARGGTLVALPDLATIELARAIRDAGGDRKIESIKRVREHEPELSLAGAKAVVEGVLSADAAEVEDLLRRGVPLSQLPMVRQATSAAVGEQRAGVLVGLFFTLGLVFAGAVVAFLIGVQPAPDVPAPAVVAESVEVKPVPVFDFDRAAMAREVDGKTELRIPLNGVDGELEARDLTIETPEGEKIELVMPDTLPYRDAVDELNMAIAEKAWLDHGTLVVQLPGGGWDYVLVEGTAMGGATEQLTVMTPPPASTGWLRDVQGSLPPAALNSEATLECELWSLFDGRGNLTGHNVTGCRGDIHEGVIGMTDHWTLDGAPQDGLPSYLHTPITFTRNTNGDPLLKIGEPTHTGVVDALKNSQYLGR